MTSQRTRHLDDILEAYLKYTEGTEPPRSYHVWVCLSMLAGALQRRVFLPWGHDTIYPNLYVILVGPSGRARKGTAMKIGKRIMKDVGIQLASESITREALIRAMNNAQTSFVDSSTGEVKWHCSLTAVSEELSVFLGQNQTDVRFLSALTDWYDSADEWKYETKGSGYDIVQGVCFNLLGGTAPEWLHSMLPEEAIGGGFTSRCIFVVETDKGQTVPKEIMNQETQQLGEAIRADLERVASMSGEMGFDPDAEEIYINWYRENDAAIQRGEPPIADPVFAGYCERRATHLRKLSIIMSASRGDDLIITKSDLNRAMNIMNAAEQNMASTFRGLGRSQYARSVDDVMKLLVRRGRVSRSELMRLMWRNIDSQELKVIKEILQQMNFVKITYDPGNNEEWYELRKGK